METVQTRRDFLKAAALSAAGLGLARICRGAVGKPPNFVIIFLDDSGWADFKPFGRPAYPTPNVEQLARDGCRFENFYVPPAVCGKWHPGGQPETRPPARGFDESCGLMYSNDMWEFHPEHPQQWGKHPLQFYENGKVTIE